MRPRLKDFHREGWNKPLRGSTVTFYSEAWNVGQTVLKRRQV